MDRGAVCGVVLNFLSNPSANSSSKLLFNIKAEMKELHMHGQYALRDDQNPANALLEKQYMNSDLYYFLREKLKFKLRIHRPSSEGPMFGYDDFTENHVPSDLHLEKLYPGDPPRKTMHRDFVVERRLLADYADCCGRRIADEPARMGFYEGRLKKWRLINIL